jgi:hypothetical protein
MTKGIIKKIIISIIIILGVTFFTSICNAQLLPNIKIQGTTPSKLVLVQQLNWGSWQSILASVIKLILAVTGSLALLSFTVGGVMMITAQGKDEQISKGKGILLWSVLALVIIAISYAIVLGITQLKFFQ